MKEVLAELQLRSDHVCYIGDDLPDLAAIRFAGLGVAVADAAAEVREAADYVTRLPGRPRRRARDDRADPQGPRPLG